MLTSICPKLPMRNKSVTEKYYIDQLGFERVGEQHFDGYLMVRKDNIEIHFFEFSNLQPDENYGQVYIRINNIDRFYTSLSEKNIPIHPNGHLQTTAWQQKEFSLLDPDKNLLTFGEYII